MFLLFSQVSSSSSVEDWEVWGAPEEVTARRAQRLRAEQLRTLTREELAAQLGRELQQVHGCGPVGRGARGSTLFPHPWVHAMQAHACGGVPSPAGGACVANHRPSSLDPIRHCGLELQPRAAQTLQDRRRPARPSGG